VLIDDSCPPPERWVRRIFAHLRRNLHQDHRGSRARSDTTIPTKKGGSPNSGEQTSICNTSAMKPLIAPIVLLGTLALSACGGDSQAGSGSDTFQTQVERKAASGDIFTLCVKNDSSRTISSTGDGSPSQAGGFIVRPGENACTSTSIGSEELIQNMMSETGPSWTTSYTYTPLFTSTGTLLREVFTTCGQKWTNKASISASLSCSGNPFRITVNFEYKGPASIANMTFADQ